MTSSTPEIKTEKYDEINDILYVHFANDNGNSYADEQEPGIEIMRDIDTDEVTGIMIFYPVARRQRREVSLKKLGYHLSLADLTQFA